MQRISTRLTAQSGNTPATYVAPDAATQQLVQVEHAATSLRQDADRRGAVRHVDLLRHGRRRVGAADRQHGADRLPEGLHRAQQPPYAALPILSAARRSGRTQRSRRLHLVKQGNIAINNAADLYLYPNTLQVVRVSGDIVRQWLEKTAEQFRLIDPTQVAPQDLVDTTFPTFNFDVLYAEGNTLRYEIDVTKPVGSRIVNLTYKAPRSIPPPSSGRHQQLPRQRRRLPGPGGRATSCCRRRTPAAMC